jgi:quinol monooxygenase YgiN
MTWAEGTDMAQVKANFTELIEYSEKEEPQTFAYHYSTSEEQPNMLLAFEQFETGEFCMQSHMKTGIFARATSYASEALTPDPLFAKRVLGFSHK